MEEKVVESIYTNCVDCRLSEIWSGLCVFFLSFWDFLKGRKEFELELFVVTKLTQWEFWLFFC